MAYNKHIRGRRRQERYPIANATAVNAGDFLKLSAGLAVVVTAASDEVLGSSAEAKAANDGNTSILVDLPEAGCHFEADLDTPTTIAIGDKLAWSADQVVTKSNTTPFAAAVKAGTSLSRVEYELLDNKASAANALASLTDSTGGTADNTLAAVGATNSGDVSATINNNFADLAAKLNAILAAIKKPNAIE